MAASLAEDAQEAYGYASEARQLAARVGVVRETAGIAAYRAGEWADALAELRTARRLTGRASYLPMMADCERALGRFDRALALVRDPAAKGADQADQIELKIVESGIRRDQGHPGAAVVTLQVPELTDGRVRPWSARLYYAYADALLEAGRDTEAKEWFGRAAAADRAGETDAIERLEELDPVFFEDLGEADDVEDLGEADDVEDLGQADDVEDLGEADDVEDLGEAGGPEDDAGDPQDEEPEPGAAD